MVIQNSGELSENIWSIYGLKRNPFTTDALLINEGYLPLDAFVGRENELKLMRTLFRMGDGTRLIVTGETGVGKTTLVNYARAEAINKNKFFTHLREMSVDESWNVNEFIAHTLSSLYNTIERLNIKEFSQAIKKKLSYLFDIMEITEEGFSLSVFGNGVGYNSSRSISTPKITTELLKRLFDETIKELNRIGFKQIVLHYNNLENLIF
jgi:Cdc6-like AAA superfamily ATPase